jgi:rhomboid protease GluP
LHQGASAQPDKLMQSRIATESKRQALDWSLVLVSQGIESVIDRDEESGWGLAVEENELARARQILEQYRIENLRWPWQQRVFHPQIAFDWASIAWVLLMCLFFWLSDRSESFREAGSMNSTSVSHGQWWRLFTAISLHADIAHLAANVVIGVVLLGFTMGRYGTGIGLLAAYLAGAGGNIAAWVIDHNHQSLGASGMVMGALGLLAVQTVEAIKRNPRSLRYIFIGLAGGIMLFVLLGFSPGTDVIAHFGGFVSGVLIGALLNFIPRLERSTGANVLAGGIFATLMIVPWRLALISK